MMDRELFVFTSSRKNIYENFDRYFNLHLIGLSLVSFITYLFVFSLTYEFEYYGTYGLYSCTGGSQSMRGTCNFWDYFESGIDDSDVLIGYALPFTTRVIYSLIMTFLELAFFYSLPYTLRFILKPRNNGKSIINEDQNIAINKNLRTDIGFSIQIRIMFLLLILFYAMIYYISGFDSLPLLSDFFTIPAEALSFANTLTGISVVIFLLPRFRVKVNFEEEYRQINKKVNMYQPLKSNTEIVLLGLVYVGISYLLTWMLIFGAIYTVLVNPWDIFRW